MSNFQRLRIMLKPYRLDLLLGFIALVVSGVSELLIPLQIQRIIDDGIAAGDGNVILTSTAIMIGLALFGMVASYGNAYYAIRISEFFAADVREITYRKIQTFSFGNLDKLQTGELLVRLTSDLNQIKLAVMMTMRMALRAPLLLVGSLAILIITSPRLSLLLLVIMPVTLALVLWYSRRTQPLYKQVQSRLDRVNTVLQENIAGVRVVKAFVRADYEDKRFGKANADYTAKNIEVNLIVAALFPSMLTIINLAIAGILWFGGNLAINTELVTTGEIVAFVNLIMMAVFPILMLGFILPMIYSAAASYDRILEVIDTDAAIVDGDNVKDVKREEVKGRVTFENVSFDYNGELSEQAVLHNISFTAEPGEMVAILGATGSGKTSLISLIPRLYEPTEGRVLLDGVDIRELSQSTLRQQVGFALQEAVLFSGTIRENIGFGRPDATDEEIEEAAKAAQAYDFIMGKEDGYLSHVEQRGKNFSGGQKQRLAIARALAVKPAVLILDDSTSAVDVETETLIQEALDELMQESTTFVVAQRISTVLKADKIIVLDRGRISGVGNHQELLANNEIYQEIYDSQLGNGIKAKPAEVTHAVR